MVFVASPACQPVVAPSPLLTRETAGAVCVRLSVLRCAATCTVVAVFSLGRVCLHWHFDSCDRPDQLVATNWWPTNQPLRVGSLPALIFPALLSPQPGIGTVGALGFRPKPQTLLCQLQLPCMIATNQGTNRTQPRQRSTREQLCGRAATTPNRRVCPTILLQEPTAVQSQCSLMLHTHKSVWLWKPEAQFYRNVNPSQ